MKLTISKTRNSLYQAAKLLGDISAINGGSGKIMKRVVRRQAGKQTQKGMGSVFQKMFK